jgi:hypothetical protein
MSFIRRDVNLEIEFSEFMDQLYGFFEVGTSNSIQSAQEYVNGEMSKIIFESKDQKENLIVKFLISNHFSLLRNFATPCYTQYAKFPKLVAVSSCLC